MITKVLCSHSALDFWLNGTNRQDIKEYLVRDFVNMPDFFEISTDENDILNFAECYNLATPIHLMMREKSDKRKNPPFIQHYPWVNVPSNSFVKISRQLYLTCPELCLLEIAGDCPFHSLVYIINCMCGTFYPDSNNPNGQHYREPVTTTAKIQEYLQRSVGAKNHRTVLRAQKYAVDNCHSSIEAAIATIMCLPFSMGGYNIYIPLSNMQALLTKQAIDLLGHEKCCPDFLWETPRKVAVEYDSNLTHLSPSQHSEDKRRYNALSMSGYTVRTLVSDNFKTLESLDLTFQDLRSALGCRKMSKAIHDNAAIRHSVAKSLFKQFH